MKILIVHNDYGKFSGEEAVVHDHAALLCEMGNEVIEYRRSSSELQCVFGAVKGFLCGLGNPMAKKVFRNKLEQNRPDVVHIHNLYPLISPAILPIAKKMNIPVVMTVHNFRLVCPNGLFAVNNHICEECAMRRCVTPCLRHRCLEGELKTLGYAMRTWIAQRKRWYLDNVDKFLCLTKFQRDKLVEYGVPSEKCTIIPNFIEQVRTDESGKKLPGSGYVGYLGRLSEEKGIDILLAVAKLLPDIPFKIAGSGHEKYADKASHNVEFMGYLDGFDKQEFMMNAKINVMTSRCYENFPTTLLQAMASGVPSVVPQLGGMPEIIHGAGECYPFCDTTEDSAMRVADILRRLWYNPEQLVTYREGAKKRIRDFTSDVVGPALLNVYNEVIAEKRASHNR